MKLYETGFLLVSLVASPTMSFSADDYNCEISGAKGAGFNEQNLLFNNVYYEGDKHPEYFLRHGEDQAVTDFDESKGSSDQECLEKIFSDPEAHYLRKYAVLDNDADKIWDFRIGPYGRFYENDEDVDNDGVLNHLDLYPFDSSRYKLSGISYDSDGDKIPDHLDWNKSSGSCVMRHDKACIQLKLYEKFDVLLMENSAEFSLTLLGVLEDVLYGVFDKTFRGQSFPITLNKIIAGKRSYAAKYVHSVGGENILANRTLFLYKDFTEIKSDNPANYMDLFNAFIILVHEVAHSIQFGYDAPKNFAAAKSENRIELKNFGDHLTGNFGVEVSPNDAVNPNTKRTYINNEDEFPSVTGALDAGGEFQSFQQISEDLSRALSGLDCDKKTMQADNYRKLLFKHGLVGEYAVLSVLEWHAISLEAYIAKLMLSAFSKSEGNSSRYQKVVQDLAEYNNNYYCKY